MYSTIVHCVQCTVHVQIVHIQEQERKIKLGAQEH